MKLPSIKKRRLATVAVVPLVIGGFMTYNALSMPDASAPAQASGCQQWIAPHSHGPAWMNMRDNGKCGDPVNEARFHQCLISIGSGTALGFFGFPYGPLAGALGGGVACGAQWVN